MEWEAIVTGSLFIAQNLEKVLRLRGFCLYSLFANVRETKIFFKEMEFKKVKLFKKRSLGYIDITYENIYSYKTIFTRPSWEENNVIQEFAY